MLFKEIVDARTDGRTDGRTHDGQWAITKAHLEHKVLRWAKNITFLQFESEHLYDNTNIFLKNEYFEHLKKYFMINKNYIYINALLSVWTYNCHDTTFLN